MQRHSQLRVANLILQVFGNKFYFVIYASAFSAALSFFFSSSFSLHLLFSFFNQLVAIAKFIMTEIMIVWNIQISNWLFFLLFNYLSKA